jgi:2',3'-cyclic-nucleotide 2'-phosphodiesterase (5'-nucleotidase family)
VAAGADVAFMNVHGIRKDLPAGPLTRKDLLEILPFRNILTTFRVSGAELLRVVRFHLETGTKILISGVSAKWKKRRDGTVELHDVEVAGAPIDRGRSYICAASDYVVGHAKEYLGTEINQPVFLRMTMAQAVEAEVRKQGKIGEVRFPGLRRIE